jgi:hypothetical protein
LSGQVGWSTSRLRLWATSDGDRAGVTNAATRGDRGGLVIARSNLRLGNEGWNFWFNGVSLDGGSDLSRSAGVIGGESVKENQLSRGLLGANGKGGLSRDDDRGGILTASPEEGLLTSTTWALAGATIVAEA